MSKPAFRIPVVRHFIACEHIEKTSQEHYSLHKVVHAIKTLPGIKFPRIHPQICLFAQMSDAGGEGTFRITLIFCDDETSTYDSGDFKLNFGEDPLVVHGLPIRLKNLLFPRPGLYEFRLFCENQIIAREVIVLRESS